MVETIWGAASFSPSLPVVEACLHKVRVSPRSGNCFIKVEAQPNDTGVQVGEWPRVNIPGHGDSREEGTTLTREDAAMVETIWGAASFSSPTPVVDACVQKVSVNPCNAKALHIVCCRVARERPEHGSRPGVPEDI
jgi:hypothetical protein